VFTEYGTVMLANILYSDRAIQDEKIVLVFQYLKNFIDVKENPRKQVGFKRKDEK
jgi:hypothetical protein